MALPLKRQIRAALKARLETISGAYRPDRVVEVPAFSGAVLNAGVKTVISMSPDFSADTFLAMGLVQVEYPIDLAICRQYGGSEDPFNPPALDRWDIQEELERAVKDRIRSEFIGPTRTSDRPLGGLAQNILIPDTDPSEENTYIEGWAVIFLRLTIIFEHPAEAS
jgi:hypothetical protein